VIAGQKEKLTGLDGFRPTGEVSGRPALHLDDLVVALRTVGPGGPARGFGCSIDVPAGAQERVNQVVYGRGRPSGGRSAVLARLPEAVGPQEVRIFGLPRDTRFAFVCVEADYLMKRQSLGLDPPPVPQVRYQFSRRQAFNRAWFKASHEPLLVSQDGHAYEIRGQGLSLDTTGAARGTAPASANAVLYAKRFTHFFPQMAKLVPAYADLWNLSDLGLLAALIRQDRLHTKASWDMRWALDASSYPLRPVSVPRTAEALANFQSGTYAVGGVYLSHAAHVAADHRETDTDGDLGRHRQRPEAGQWSHVQRP
ncbi:MAG: DUF1598 domain-containing protein, partial [Phycisphaerae bacterium]|nr:DUF1598 domain-containing protein [Phycisphaerae bacterium]